MPGRTRRSPRADRASAESTSHLRPEPRAARSSGPIRHEARLDKVQRRFLDAVGVAWERASRAEARDFSCWIQLTVKQRLQTSRPEAARWSSPGPVAANAVPGKPAPGDGYAPAPLRTARRCCAGFTTSAGTRAPVRC